MKFIHIADLHLGKSIYGTSLIEKGDQIIWVDRFLEIVDDKKPDAIVIAGDVFDRSAPSEEAIRLFSRMVTSLHDRHIPVLTIAGNHDSVHRLSYFGDMLSKLGVHFSSSLTSGIGDSEVGESASNNRQILNHITIEDEYGPVTFWLMPYVFPALIQSVLDPNHKEENLRDYDKAVRALLAAQPVDTEQRNVIIAHQNVTANGEEVERGGSESMIGGIGQVDYTAFDMFEYVALGHIHAAYPVGRNAVRYAGSPLCYHFDETRQSEKGPLLVTLGEKGTQPYVETLRIEPLHRMKDLIGTYEEIRDNELNSSARGEYVRITIIDQRLTPAISQFFRELYTSRGSILMEITSTYNAFTGDTAKVTSDKINSLSVEDLFAEFYRERRGDEEPSQSDFDIISFAGELMRNTDIHMPIESETVDKLIKHILAIETPINDSVDESCNKEIDA